MVQASVGFHCPDCVAQYRKANPSPTLPWQTKPVATYALIGINVAVFLLGVVVDAGAALSNLNPFGADAGLYGFDSPTDTGVAAGEWWRMISSAFLHAGPFHLVMNMLVLYLLGSQLERAIGVPRYVGLYITSMFAGAFGVLLVEPQAVTVGASGAVFGLMGAAFALQKRQGVDPWASGIGGLILINVMFTFLYPGISVGGHLGGLLGGAVTGYVLFNLEDRSRSLAPALAACAALSVAFFLGGLWAADQYADPVLGFLNFSS